MNARITALAVGMLSSPAGGYRGDMLEELWALLPMYAKGKLLAHIDRLKARKNLIKLDGYWHLDKLPYVAGGKLLYHKEIRRKESFKTLTPDRLIRLYSFRR